MTESTYPVVKSLYYLWCCDLLAWCLLFTIKSYFKSHLFLFSQAVHCSVDGIRASGSEWNIPPEKLQQYIKLNIKYTSVCHHVTNTKHGKTYSIEMVADDGVDVAETLVSLGVAQSLLNPVESKLKHSPHGQQKSPQASKLSSPQPTKQ